MAVELKDVDRLYNFHLVNGKIFSCYLNDASLKEIRRKWIISNSRGCGELVINNYIIQSKDLICIGLDISEEK